MGNNDKIFEEANPHTIKKFELIEKYVEGWAHKLLKYPQCKGIVFIDCMSNRGEYVDKDGKQVFGTPVRVAKYLRSIADSYSQKSIDLYFSDISEAKTNHLKSLMPNETSNFHIHIKTIDGNELLKDLAKKKSNNINYLLVYDPYEAKINWEAIMPFINIWGEIILNHMVSDSVRAVPSVRKDETRRKYEQTYMTELENLILYGSDKNAFEKRIEDIIKFLRIDNDRKYYIAAFPFFNKKNSEVYYLIHSTSSIDGFKLFKKSAWQTFGGKSSTKNTYGSEKQLKLDFEGSGLVMTEADEFCYYIKDIADYLQKSFCGRSEVKLDEIWGFLDNHPVFPSDGFKNKIKEELKQFYGAKVSSNTISFIDRGKSYEEG